MNVTASGGAAGVVSAAQPAQTQQPASAEPAGHPQQREQGQPEPAQPEPAAPGMSTQDFMALHSVNQDGPRLSLAQMLEWLMAVKLLEATSKDRG